MEKPAAHHGRRGFRIEPRHLTGQITT